MRGNPGSLVSIATCHTLDSTGIKSWRRQDCPTPIQTVLGPMQPPVQGEPSYSQQYSNQGMVLTENAAQIFMLLSKALLKTVSCIQIKHIRLFP
jgi:hypothetical protein